MALDNLTQHITLTALIQNPKIILFLERINAATPWLNTTIIPYSLDQEANDIDAIEDIDATKHDGNILIFGPGIPPARRSQICQNAGYAWPYIYFSPPPQHDLISQQNELITQSSYMVDSEQNLAVSLPVAPGLLLDLITQIHLHIYQHDKNIFLQKIITPSFEMDPADQHFTNVKTGQKAKLTQKEYHLLFALYHAPDFWMSKQALLETIWGHVAELETHTLETHIYRLRQKIETNPSKPDLFINDNQGYYLNLTST